IGAQLQVVLENLGPVQARFRLVGTTLALSLESSAPSLRAALPQLRERLAARGLAVVALEMAEASR
ncbi:MAG TPA: flagellar hook-length control protein FliK, partial [Burkholderiaceae bacterium]